MRNSQTKNPLFYWSISVALAGFLFGFDTIVISGADLPIKELWTQDNDLFHGIFIMSMALWGTVIGALFGGIPCDLFGRKKTLFWIGILYLVSALGSGLAPDPYTFSFFRFIGGLGVGASSVAAPTYISEIAPTNNRGRLVALYQFNIVFGILIAFISNALFGGFGDKFWVWFYGSSEIPSSVPQFLISGVGDNAWRWMLGIEALPALLYSIMVLGVPNSPRWLIIKKRDTEKAREILSVLNPDSNADELVADIKKTKAPAKGSGIFSGKYNKVLLLAFLLAFFNQLSGINFVLYYAPRLLIAAGSEIPLLNSISIGVVNLIFTLIGMYLIDRAGRRQLMIIGSIGYFVSLAIISWGYFSGANQMVILIFLLAFIASHAIGQGAVIWVFISEIFPNNVRAFGQSWGSGTHWVFAALITALTPFFISLVGNNPWPIFAFFSAMMVLQLLFALFMMPETKGVSLEDLEKRLIG